MAGLTTTEALAAMTEEFLRVSADLKAEREKKTELLRALQDALSIFNPEPGEQHPAPLWATRASAAIAKATGETP